MEEIIEKKKKCCFGIKDVKGNNEYIIFVMGFDNSGFRDEIRSVLVKYFSLCGELMRVFVYIECEIGVFRGYVFINLKKCGGEIEVVLFFNGSDLGGYKFLVIMVRFRDEYYVYFNFNGCEICCVSYVVGC